MNVLIGTYQLEKAVVLEDMRRVAAVLAVQHPTFDQYHKHGLFNLRHLKVFGTWQALCAEAGMPWTIRTRQPEITLEMLVENVKTVAERLRMRILSYSRYQEEGSFSNISKIMKRNGVVWADVCRAAHLLPCGRGVRGIDLRRCACGRFISWRGRGHTNCKHCRRKFRLRKIGMPVEWETSRGTRTLPVTEIRQKKVRLEGVA